MQLLAAIGGAAQSDTTDSRIPVASRLLGPSKSRVDVLIGTARSPQHLCCKPHSNPNGLRETMNSSGGKEARSEPAAIV
jgi:hypothetical protein